jgi:hypothetical protein
MNSGADKGMTMTKAYDLKVLIEKMKAAGLDASEEVAKKMIGETFAWIEESAKLSPLPYDDLALVVLPKVKEFVLLQVDKIDGQVG